MTAAAQRTAARNTLAARIRAARNVSVQNDPSRTYRASANRCRKGQLSYSRLFGIGKAPKAAA